MRLVLVALAAPLLGCGVSFAGSGTASSSGGAGQMSGIMNSGAGGAPADAMGVGAMAGTGNPGGGDATGTGGSGGSGANGGGGVGGAGGAPNGGAGGGCVGDVKYVATVADCIDHVTPNPDTCEQFTGSGHMLLDTNLAGPETPHSVFLRFDPAAHPTAIELTVSVTVSNHPQADATQTGELWAVQPFDRNDLFSSVPADVTLLAADQGSVAPGNTVTFQLPVSLLDGSPIHLAMHPVNTDHPVYWNANGNGPPELSVACP